jgi:hypothetical protein
MKYFKVHYMVVRGKEILAESIFAYADEKQLPPLQLKDSIKHLRMKNYPDESPIEIKVRISPSEIEEEEYRKLLAVQ